MTEQFEAEIVFGLPPGEHDPYELSDAVFEAGFEDAIVGTGHPRLLSVELDGESNDAKAAILGAARAIIRRLPAGAELREVRPDLVSLADVAEKLGVTRQTLQKRAMPVPFSHGLYRIDEVAASLRNLETATGGGRKPRFNIADAEKWFAGGSAARQLNALIALHEIDVHSAELMGARTDADHPRHAHLPA